MPNPLAIAAGACAYGLEGDVPDEGDAIGGDDVAEDVDESFPVPAAPSAQAAAAAVVLDGSGAPSTSDIDSVRRFLRQVRGVPEKVLEGTWDVLIGYVQCRFS